MTKLHPNTLTQEWTLVSMIIDKRAEVPHAELHQDPLDLVHPLHSPLVEQDQPLRVIRDVRNVGGAPRELDASGEVMGAHHRRDDDAILHVRPETN